MPEQGKRIRPELLGRIRYSADSAFEAELARQAAERHARLLEPDGFPRNPPGFRAEDFVDGGGDGFLPLPEAAREMGVSERELRDLVRRGLIETDGRGRARPASVSVLAVRGPGRTTA